jgi:hypothetical protein
MDPTSDRSSTVGDVTPASPSTRPAEATTQPKIERETDAVFRANYETLLKNYKTQKAQGSDDKDLKGLINQIRAMTQQMKHLEQEDQLIKLTKLFCRVFNVKFLTKAEREEKLLGNDIGMITDKPDKRKTDAEVRSDFQALIKRTKAQFENLETSNEARKEAVKTIENMAEQVKEIERSDPLAAGLTNLSNLFKHGFFQTDAEVGEKLALELSLVDIKNIKTITEPNDLEQIKNLSPNAFRYLIKKNIFDASEESKIPGETQYEFYNKLPQEQQSLFMKELFTCENWSVGLYQLLDNKMEGEKFPKEVFMILQSDPMRKHIIDSYADPRQKRNFTIEELTTSKGMFQQLLHVIPILNCIENLNDGTLDQKLDQFMSFIKSNPFTSKYEDTLFQEIIPQIPSMKENNKENNTVNEFIRFRLVHMYTVNSGWASSTRCSCKNLFTSKISDEKYIEFFKATIKHSDENNEKKSVNLQDFIKLHNLDPKILQDLATVIHEEKEKIENEKGNERRDNPHKKLQS